MDPKEIEVIYWRDACGWCGDSDAIQRLKLPLVRTLGEVIKETKDVIYLRSHFGIRESDSIIAEPADEGNSIPKAWIVQRITYRRKHALPNVQRNKKDVSKAKNRPIRTLPKGPSI